MIVLHSRAFKALALVSCLATASFAPTAFAAVDVYLNVAPPNERIEVVPPPRAGYAWAPGYWAWRGHRQLWVQGHWEPARIGFHWYRDRWDRTGDGLVFYRGHWEQN